MNRRNSFFPADFKTRAEPDGKYIEGYFAVYRQQTKLWGDVYEMIEPGAFDKSLAENDIRCLFNHDTNVVLGRTGAGTLELKSDEYGLWGSVKINEEDREAVDIWARVDRGDLSGCSFGFLPSSERYEKAPDGSILWHVEEADTREVSVCTFPAYPQTEISARQADYTAYAEREKKINRDDRIANINQRLEALKC